MPAPVTRIAVSGAPHQSRADMLVLSERLDGYDTFLSGTLEVHGEDFPVRILTLDDVTVLRLGGGRPGPPTTECKGTLHLSHGARPLSPPDDLTELAHDRRKDLTTLDEAELRYALTFLGEATTASIRAGRAAVIVDALPALSDDGSASPS